MASMVGIALIFLIIFSLLKGIDQVGRVFGQVDEGFQTERQLAICANLLAIEANLRSAKQFWQTKSCFESEAEMERLDLDLGEVLQNWQERYPEVNFALCESVGGLRLQTHLEKNGELSPDYPNWTVHYSEEKPGQPRA